jgi:hypothetical protein
MASSDVGTALYCGDAPTTRRKKEPKKTMQKVPMQRKYNSSEVSSGKKKPARLVKKRALKPKADRGKAVAVPR